jgi:sterol 24-C-methyltransferase
VYEWLMTDNYDNDNPEHRKIRLGIEQGDGISNMEKIPVALEAVKKAGFTLEFNEDLADRDDPAPWYWPLDGDFRYITTIGDFLTILRMTKLGRGTIHKVLGFFESFGILPGGTQKTADSLAEAADNLVKGGKEKLFTPMYLIKAVKPKN